ncbi:MAG: aminotransferase class V-fold PLP-dependent enzyme [Candidatus Promineifilaceae bacterium]
MEQFTLETPEESLDPADWPAMRALGHRMVDDMMTLLEKVRERPVWQPIPEEVKTYLRQPAPREPQDPEKVYQDFLENVLTESAGNIHPRFWGWVMGTGTPLGMLADMLASGLNPNMGGGEHAPVYVEEQVLDWCKEMLGFPADASGLLVSGGSMANLVGLVVARNTMAKTNLRKHGLGGTQRRMMVYASSEVHSSVQKAVELLGLGSNSLRIIPVNAEFQIDVRELEEAVAQDKAAGHEPFCIVGCAGTVNTGAFDDLDRLADISQSAGLWFHVDGAFGALAALSPDLDPLTSGMERADSLAFDLHKWMYMPFEVGCALVRNEESHRRSFSLLPDYLTHSDRGLAAGGAWFSEYGVQLTRGYRALKVWMSLKEHGLTKYGRLIQQNVDQARYLAGLVEEVPELELLAPVPLNVVCFRYRVTGFDDDALNDINNELLLRLHEGGKAVPSSTMIEGKFAIRAAITNHRSRREDFDLLVREVLRLGREVQREGSK